jgi:hypothetical protein
MKSLRMVLAVLVLMLAWSGCTKQDSHRVTDPVPRPNSPEIKEGRWITAGEETRDATARAAKSPLMVRAVQENGADPRLGFVRESVVGAIGTASDGSAVRFTILPYQFNDDLDHATYFALVEAKGTSHVETFELIRNRRPTEEGFERVNSGEHGVWMRSGPTYTTSPSGIVRRAPERFNFAKFGACFVPLADRLLGAVHETCHSMGDFPGCTTFGSAGAIAGAALYCAWASWNG